MELGAALEAVSLIVKYGLPAIVDAYNTIKDQTGREPTLDEIRGLVIGLEPPEKY